MGREEKINTSHHCSVQTRPPGKPMAQNLSTEQCKGFRNDQREWKHVLHSTEHDSHQLASDPLLTRSKTLSCAPESLVVIISSSMPA